jgi:DNA helicase II / ATP-dependent DNA helicase PcrA
MNNQGTPDKTNGKPLEDAGSLLERFLREAETAQRSRDTSASSAAASGVHIQADYDEPEITDLLQEKIRRLNDIVAGIEGRYEPAPPKPPKLERRYKIDYLAELNEAQYQAVTHRRGPLLVIAGAGTGKTRVIVYRVAYLIENGASPESILLLTFTRKAAQEMLNRVARLLADEQVRKTTGGTFHGFASRMLRQYAPVLDLRPGFTIIDAQDSEDTVDLIRTELKFHKTQKAFPKKGRIYEIISSARNRDLTIAKVIGLDFTGLSEYVSEIELIASGYARYKQICNILDYDDLLELFRQKLREKPDFLSRLQSVYQWIMVDEFQDTNSVQRDIVDLLAGAHRNVMVVGDDAQSIYAFRGANYENILRFPETWPDCRIVKIEQNYRSHPALLDFSNRLIRQARIGYRKELFSRRLPANKPQVCRFFDQGEEAAYIVDRVLELREKGLDLREVAVLFRSSWHGRYIEAELLRRNIPYVVVGGLRFSERRHIKDVMAYLRVVLNPYDEVAWHRILLLVPGVGKTTAGRITASIRQKGGLSGLEDFKSKSFWPALGQLMHMLVRAGDHHGQVHQVIGQVVEYYQPLLREHETDADIRMGDIAVFQSMSQSYRQLEAFLTDFALEPPSRYFQNRTAPLIDEGEENPLTLSTVHSAKGLEWHTVFIPHTLDGLFPTARALKNFEELEEERRLFYVACSRAREQLVITMPSSVASYSAFFSYPSRFIAAIEDQWFEAKTGR